MIKEGILEDGKFGPRVDQVVRLVLRVLNCESVVVWHSPQQQTGLQRCWREEG